MEAHPQGSGGVAASGAWGTGALIGIFVFRRYFPPGGSSSLRRSLWKALPKEAARMPVGNATTPTAATAMIAANTYPRIVSGKAPA